MSDAVPIPFALPQITDADADAVVRVLRSGWLTTGTECAALERELAEYLAAPYVVAMSSCTAALETALASLHLPSGSKVGVPTWTFAATALAVLRSGATPVMMDIDAETLNLSLASTLDALERGLSAIILVHFGGVVVDRQIFDQCRNYGVPIIEDAAHAFGSYDGATKLAGQHSTAACFSFYATKNLTCAEGGALSTWDPELADFARSFRLHGLDGDAWRRYKIAGYDYDIQEAGIKGNMSDVHAALARSQLIRFDTMQAARRALVQRYRSNIHSLSDVRCVPSESDNSSSDHLMVVAFRGKRQRDSAIERLAADNIASSVHFKPLHHLSIFRDYGADRTFPISDEMAGRVLSLPLYPTLSQSQVDRVCRLLVDK